MAKALWLSVVFAGVFSLPSPTLAKEDTRALKFPRGTAAITVKASISGREGRAYVVQAQAGQTLQVLFKPSNTSCYFNAFEPGSPEAAHIGSIAGNEFGRSPTLDGVYKLQVYVMRSAARRQATCRFALSVELTGLPGGGTAGVSETVMKDRCTREAAPMYGVQPRRITLSGLRIVASGYEIDGRADKGKDGHKKLRCIFNAQRVFSHIMALTPDGE